MKLHIEIELGGTQTKTHCSITSSINACGKLDSYKQKCTLFRKKLEYDWDSHAYKRCEECKRNEVSNQ